MSLKISLEEDLKCSIDIITNIIKDKTLPDHLKLMQIKTILEKLQCKITSFNKIISFKNMISPIDSNKDEKYFEELKLTKTEVADWIRKLIPYIENPVILAPEGCFTEKQEIKPGAILQYDPTLLAREPQIINQTENLKTLVELYTSLGDYTEEDGRILYQKIEK